MKVRNGFVSNSSSSSFVVRKGDITPAQVKIIKAHIIKAQKMNEEYGLREFEKFSTQPDDEWEIHETDTTLEGYHYIDNFEMDKFMRMIGVNMDLVEFNDVEPSWSTRWSD